MKLFAPAKINWTLELLGRRGDGYHEISSVMQTVSLCDALELRAAASPGVKAFGEHAVEPDSVAAALRALGSHARREISVEVLLEKRIPVAAGLGGGSSDAAATLRGLSKLLRMDLGRQELADIGAGLGSDVPFFAYGGTALVEGRGERVTPLADVKTTWLVLLAPPFRLDDKTSRMYGALHESDFTDGSRTSAAVAAIRGGSPLNDAMLYNAFERAAYELFGELAQCREALLQAGARRVHLAGSGPSLFAPAGSEVEVEAMLGRLGGKHGAAYALRTLSAAEATIVNR
ncbi:MAG: 4-(cytidine 5'-diphospho)-2-C-methyl-D-erythritol kinase [Dongiaceae bacterium]